MSSLVKVERDVNYTAFSKFLGKFGKGMKKNTNNMNIQHEHTETESDDDIIMPKYDSNTILP